MHLLKSGKYYLIFGILMMCFIVTFNGLTRAVPVNHLLLTAILAAPISAFAWYIVNTMRAGDR